MLYHQWIATCGDFSKARQRQIEININNKKVVGYVLIQILYIEAYNLLLQ